MAKSEDPALVPVLVSVQLALYAQPVVQVYMKERVPAEVEAVLLQEPGLPRGRSDITIDDWHLIHDMRTSAGDSSPTGDTGDNFLDENEQVGEYDRHKGRQQRGLGHHLYVPCTSRGIATFIEATNEIDIMAMEAPPHSHTIIAGDYNGSFNKNITDGETVGPSIIEREIHYAGRPVVVRPSGRECA